MDGTTDNDYDDVPIYDNCCTKSDYLISNLLLS